MAFPTSAELTELIAPVTEARGLDVEFIKASPAGKKSTVQIRLDADTSPTLDELEEISNDIGELFDAAEASGRANFGAGYTLEVSTPGTDLPLKLPRHWRRNRHRLVNVNGRVGRAGALNDAEDEVIVVYRSKKQLSIESLPLLGQHKAVVEIEFNEPPEEELEITGLSYDEALKRREDNK
ncbi:ribosome maturation factor RimP [Corynebacterium yudongzhengii]|uniref:Ribosome maturation factor RimP n=1 Tax=Corynebacterium yudongzhengii TaxID=2080740 RepID=A0A2U1T5C7_9CORY|nr:ribosome maturation factor RimP [Corynebacterium yudongzhengii]AWB82945.1 ribosome maturation factor RimP [Corynebacterium yudongzhengii]PWC01193.1 ribosome maturation factor RimP [Corynebacterium yudongzhengii]